MKRTALLLIEIGLLELCLVNKYLLQIRGSRVGIDYGFFSFHCPYLAVIALLFLEFVKVAFMVPIFNKTVRILRAES